MNKTSALFQAREQERCIRRTWAAQDAWRAAGYTGAMLCEWQKLFECTLLNDKQLGRAINWKLDLLEREIKNLSLTLEAKRTEHFRLQLDRMARRDAYRP